MNLKKNFITIISILCISAFLSGCSDKTLPNTNANQNANKNTSPQLSNLNGNSAKDVSLSKDDTQGKTAASDTSKTNAADTSKSANSDVKTGDIQGASGNVSKSTDTSANTKDTGAKNTTAKPNTNNTSSNANNGTSNTIGSTSSSNSTSVTNATNSTAKQSTANTQTKQPTAVAKQQPSEAATTVYYIPGNKVYYLSKTSPALKNIKNIQSISLKDAKAKGMTQAKS